MNRVILLLNVVILVVTFVVALSATDSHIGLLRSASAAHGGVIRARAVGANPSMAFLRTVHALGNFMPLETLASLTTNHLEAIRSAVRRYYLVVDASATAASRLKIEGRDLLQAYEELGRRARGEVEAIVSEDFKDRAVVSRLTAEIIRSCR